MSEQNNSALRIDQDSPEADSQVSAVHTRSKPLSRVQEKQADVAAAAFLQDVLAGLGQTRKTLPCKWFYDAHGSKLFEQICETEEYYVTRTEISLLQDVCGEVASIVGAHAEVLEPGSGAGVKIRTLLDALDAPQSFIPIDISESAVEESAAALRQAYPELVIHPLVADFTADFSLPESFHDDGVGRRVIFFPGSTISNFDADSAVTFLSRLRGVVREGDYLFIGVDLVKDAAVLEAAYDDKAGITAAFNKNLLKRMVRELETDIDPDAFDHQAVFNHEESRIEMHLVSAQEQLVQIDGKAHAFRRGETIHTENSYKFTLDGFRKLACRAGFAGGKSFTDAQGYFSLHLLEAMPLSKSL